MARELFKFRLFGKLIVFEYVGTARPGEPEYDVVPQPVVEEPVQTGLYMPIPLAPQSELERSRATITYPMEYPPEAGAPSTTTEHPLDEQLDASKTTIEHPPESGPEPSSSSETIEQPQDTPEPARQSTT